MLRASPVAIGSSLTSRNRSCSGGGTITPTCPRACTTIDDRMPPASPPASANAASFTFITYFLHHVVMPVGADPNTAQATDRVGLCASCRFVDVVTSSRGSTFYLCTLSATNPAFPRYPALPVRVCSGYQPERSVKG
jgi:hypothetical protein